MIQKRIFELDCMRVAAILLMVVFHFSYDLQVYAGAAIDCESMPLYLIGKTAALLFMFVSGISSCIGKRTLRRGVTVFCCGMLVTIATLLFDPAEYVRFGILHFLGVSMLLSLILQRLGRVMLGIIAAASAVVGLAAQSMTANTFLLVPFGILYKGFVSIDYYPLFPYLSVYIIGIIVYKSYYQNGKLLLLSSNTWFGSAVVLISKHSLLIYLLHQPILVGLMLAIGHI